MTPLVLVHGFMGGSDQWTAQIEGLTDQLDMICVDLPGFGKNAHLPAVARIEDFADWVIAHLRSRGVERYHLLGHSMGGMVAQEMALRDRIHIDRLILYATGAIGVLPGRFETIAESKRRAHADGARATARRISATWFLDKEQAPGFEPCAAIATLATQASIQAGLDAMEAWSGSARLGEVASETLVLWGDQDRTYPWQQIHRLWTQIPKTSLAVVPGCAHAVHAEKPNLFKQLIADFLSPE